MANTKTKSQSDVSLLLAKINSEILALEQGRSAILEAELENAQARVDEIQSLLSGAQAKPKRAAKKGAKRRGRPRGSRTKKRASSGKNSAAGEKPAAAEKPKGDKSGDRLGTVKALVKAAGQDGISARRVAKSAGLPYIPVLKILNTGSDFRKIGERRDRRYFLK